MKSLKKGIEYIEPNNIRYDVNNPRGEKEHQIVSDKSFEKLVDSIKEHGVLEPLIVKNDIEGKTKYILIDGERRWRAAKIAVEGKDIDRVPILIAKDDTDGRILAYQVHMLRKQWEKAAETKAIKMIIQDLKQDNADISEKDISKKLEEITGHSDKQIEELTCLIKYDDSVITKVIEGKINVSYPIQNEFSFINPLKRNYSKLFTKYGENNIRNILIYKAEKGLLHSTRFFMDKFKYIFQDKVNIKQIEILLDKFLGDKNMSSQDVLEKWNPETSKKLMEVKKLGRPKKGKTKKQNAEKKEIVLTTKQSIDVANVRKGFEDIGKILSVEEYDYIGEAITCIENGCFRAAIVMIWGATINRVLENISKDFDNFKVECRKINTTKKPYSYFKNSYDFICRSTKCNSIDDLRNGNDLPLIAFLLFKQYINDTEYKKLVNGYNTRCDCTHPTKIQLTPNEVIAICHNCLMFIFRNKNIK